MKNRVGLGTFPLASVFHKVTPRSAEDLVREFLDKGGFYIDTAPLYGNGEVESLLGRALKGIPREKYYLITKTVKFVDEKGKIFVSGHSADIISQIDNSLKRLRVDFVDQLMVHSPDESVSISETLHGLEEVQRKGKTKELAVSNVSLEELKEFNKTGKIKYVQNRFSLINRSISADFEKYLLENEISLIPYHLLEIGLLTRLALSPIHLHKDDLRQKLPYWSQENQEVISHWVQIHLLPLATELNITIGQLNLAWALKQPFIKFVVAGTTNPEYLGINLQASHIKLSQSVLNKLEEAYKNLEELIAQKYHKSIRAFRGLNEKFF